MATLIKWWVLVLSETKLTSESHEQSLIQPGHPARIIQLMVPVKLICSYRMCVIYLPLEDLCRQYVSCQKNTMLLIVLWYISNGKLSADTILAQTPESFLGSKRALDSSGVSQCISKKFWWAASSLQGFFPSRCMRYLRGLCQLN